MKDLFNYIKKECDLVHQIFTLMKELPRLPAEAQILLIELQKRYNTVITSRNISVRTCQEMCRYAFNNGLKKGMDQPKFCEICQQLTSTYIRDCNAALERFKEAIKEFEETANQLLSQKDWKLIITGATGAATLASGALGIASLFLIGSGVFLPLGVGLGLASIPSFAASSVATGINGHAYLSFGEADKLRKELQDDIIKIDLLTKALKAHIDLLQDKCVQQQGMTTDNPSVFETTLGTVIDTMNEILKLEIEWVPKK